MRNHLFPIVVVLFLSSGWVHSATFHCDPAKGSPDGDGSAQRPWGTIEQVIARKLIQSRDASGNVANPAAPVKAGDTILLRSGWHGAIRIPSGYNDQFITIAAESGQSPQVAFVEIRDGRKWRIKGLTISPSLSPTKLDRAPRNLVMLGEHGGEDSAELVVEDCFVYSVLDASAWTAKDWIEKPASGIWLGRHGKRHIARNNYVLNTRFGINLCAPECLCEGNIVANFSGDGIRATRDGLVVQYNVVKNIFVSDADGDKNHDDGIQVFLFNAGRGTVRDITFRGNIILSREDDSLPFPNAMQGIGCFDGPLVNFTVEKNIVCVNHYHGISLYDAQGCTIRDNACFSRWGGRAIPWIMLGQKINQAKGNTVRDNLAHSYNFKADAQVKSENNASVTEAAFRRKLDELATFIDDRFGKVHPVAQRPRLLAGPRAAAAYFPPPESQGGWRRLDKPEDLRRLAGVNPDKLRALKQWLLDSDKRDFAAVVIRNGYIVLEVERGNSAITDARRVASVSKAVCATVLAVASEQSRNGLTPRKMTFDDPAFDFIPWAQPLSDPRKAKITIRQLLNHTSGICPEATGAPNDGTWDYILGHAGDDRTAKLAFDPGTACGYSTHALAHAALVCETVAGKPYDQFAVESLFKPLGIEHWWFQSFDGADKYGRHPSHALGMPARDLARIAYCMLRNGRWNDRQVIPRWFVEQTGASSHDVKTPELRWKLNPQTFTLGWERPSVLTGEDGRSGQGIPADARSKPGSGGQFIAFVPSLDLVITRQTGASGNWPFEEYLRLACAAVLQDAPAPPPAGTSAGTHLSIANGRWHIDGRVTCPGTAAQGLLMNVRMVNSTFEDRAKPDFDPAANTARFIARIPDYTAHGVRAFTLCLQGGMPGYEGAVNSAFNLDGSLREPYLARVQRVIEACDRHGAAVILGCYYQRQSKILRDEAAVRAGVVNVARWIQTMGFRNVAMEIANEYPHRGFVHPILKSPTGQAQLIRLARQTCPGLLVSSSGYGDGRLHDDVAEAGDFLLIHFNGTPVAEIPARIAALRRFNKPIVCNEDDKTGEQAALAAEACVRNGASYGLMLSRLNQYVPFEFNGAADDPVVYAMLKKLTSVPAQRR